MIEFADRQTPDLQFDRIIYALGSTDPGGRIGRLGIALAYINELARRLTRLREPEPVASAIRLWLRDPDWVRGLLWRRIEPRAAVVGPLECQGP